MSCLCSTGLYAATISEPPSDLQEGLVLYMNFDNARGQYDSYTGYSNALPSWGTGQPPTMGGTGAFGSQGYNPSASNPGSSLSGGGISTQNFTVSFSFKDWNMALNAYALRMTTSAGETLQFQSYSEGGASLLFQLFVGGGTGYVGGIENATVNANKTSWQSFTMTSSDSGIKLYLDGNLMIDSSKVLKPGTLSFFQLGCNNNGTNVADFKTDDFGLWNRALTEEEVKFLANNPANTKMPNAAIPEPGTATLALFGLTSLLTLRRRRKS